MEHTRTVASRKKERERKRRRVNFRPLEGLLMGDRITVAGLSTIEATRKKAKEFPFFF